MSSNKGAKLKTGKMQTTQQYNSWSNNVIERKPEKAIKLPSKPVAPRQAQTSKSWAETKSRAKPSLPLKYGLFQRPRKATSPLRVMSPIRVRGLNTLRNPAKVPALHQRATVMKDKMGDRVKNSVGVKREVRRMLTNKGSSQCAVVCNAPPTPKLGMSETLHLDIKPGKGRIVTPRVKEHMDL